MRAFPVGDVRECPVGRLARVSDFGSCGCLLPEPVIEFIEFGHGRLIRSEVPLAPETGDDALEEGTSFGFVSGFLLRISRGSNPQLVRRDERHRHDRRDHQEARHDESGQQQQLARPFDSARQLFLRSVAFSPDKRHDGDPGLKTAEA